MTIRAAGFSRLALALLLAGFGLGTTGCEKDTPPPPLPTTEPVKKDSAALELEPEPDAGVEDAGTPPPRKGKGTPGKSGPSLAACCKALEQNVASAPPSMQGYYVQAAAACQMAVQTGATSVVPSIKAALKNAQMPAGCL
jgi:hypothetical protein